MANARQLLSPDDRQRVEQAVAEAEEHTSAEIVCALATESGRYDRAEALVGFAGALFGLWLVNALHVAPADSWDVPAISLLWQAGGAGVGFLLGNVLASYVHPLRVLGTPTREMEEEVTRAANHVFTSRRVSATAGRGGVLVYLSLFERQAVVLADQGAFSVLEQQGVDSARDAVVAKLREGAPTEALIEGVKVLAAGLAEGLPVKSDDENELSNELLLFHPRP